DVTAPLEAARLVEGAGEHRNIVEVPVLPEQHGAAIAAKAAACVGRGGVPAEHVGPFDLDRVVGDVGGGKIMSTLLSALRAMAIDNAAQPAMRTKTDGAAQTRAGIS